MKHNIYKNVKEKIITYSFDDEKIKYFKQFCNHAQRENIKIFLVNSPCFEKRYETYTLWKNQVLALIKEYDNIQYIEINQYTHPKIFSRHEIYKDSSHLNGNGAAIFTKLLLKEIKSKL